MKVPRESLQMQGFKSPPPCSLSPSRCFDIECVRCHDDCALCDGPDIDDCTLCQSDKNVRYSGECLSECPSQTYYDETSKECKGRKQWSCYRTFILRFYSCLTCSGSEPTSCLTCAEGRQKDATGHCVWYSECSPSSYKDQNGKCQQCHKHCHGCNGPGKDHCLSCNSPHFLLHNTCVPQCPEGYYVRDQDERLCGRCHFSCKTCTGHHSVECVTCKPGFFKQGETCVETCSEGSGKKTKPCSQISGVVSHPLIKKHHELVVEFKMPFASRGVAACPVQTMH
uniref:Growth factor receptor domain-containing protein n=1 Tax=Pundamilia nyererei TaxID=303518 RepID=A0A3B4G7S8_9CICH